MHYLVFIILAPWLFLQGKRVKQNTPRLPEAAGERIGVSGDGSALSVLVLGDSAAAGVGVAQQSEALTGVVVKELARQYQVNWQLLAKSGSNTEKVTCMLDQLLSVTPSLRFDVVIVSLGVNDVLSPLSVKRWIKQQKVLIELIATKANCQRLVLTRVPPMGDFPVLPQPLRWFLGKRSNEFNRYLEKLAAENSCFTLLDFGHQLDASAMAKDGFHPGQAIYQDWGKSAAEVIIKSLN
ncbi:SGNH/GDSL hydrolase family protein [Shewanella sp. 10N.261.52.F9]|uniref:SGNH/GDSL hydrolase family protein n=1 Tax=Shewanella sp. 10N.261.52.F9 TaxID=3229684 RepID=UPI0035538A1C